MVLKLYNQTYDYWSDLIYCQMVSTFTKMYANKGNNKPTGTRIPDPPFFLIWSLPRLWYGSLSGSISLNHLSIFYNISCYNSLVLLTFEQGKTKPLYWLVFTLWKTIKGHFRRDFPHGFFFYGNHDHSSVPRRRQFQSLIIRRDFSSDDSTNGTTSVLSSSEHPK
jgi:hypothetical protein